MPNKELEAYRLSEAALRRSNQLLDALSRAQSRFISDVDPNTLFDELLSCLLTVTGSEYGFIGQVLHTEEKKPYLKNFATTDISWNDSTREYYEKHAPEGLEFHNMNTLFGAVITTGKTVISNDPSTDPRGAGIPEGHPPLKAFLGIPFFAGETMVGMAGIANRPGGYDHGVVDFLTPLITTCANIIAAFRVDQRRRKAEASLKESEERLKAILDNSATVVYVKDLDGRYILINRRYETLFHVTLDDIRGRTDHDIFPKDKADLYRANDLEVIASGVPMEFEEIAPQDDGIHTYISIKFPLFDTEGKPSAVCGISTDITERKRAEEDRLKIQKLESLGVLAGGIAHDFNNLLTGISGNVSLIRRSIGSDDKNLRRLEELERAAVQASALTTQLLTFSKGGKPVKEVLSIKGLLEESTGFALTGSNVSAELSVAEDLWAVEADPGQVSQAVSNLVINADQAMPEGGVLRVSARNRTIGPKEALPLAEGRYVEVEVEDQGVGIPEEYLGKIFDPYFTTKQQGSGLGLSSVFSIIRNHQGHIEVASKAGQGTTFLIYLPASESTPPVSFRSDEVVEPGQGRVLVMDDEEVVRDVAGEILSTIGYEVELAREGAEAVEMYRRAMGSGTPFDAVIMDLTVPGGMGGKEAVKRLLEIDPGARVVVSSGYSNDEVMADYERYGFKGVVVKPYKLSELSEGVRRVLGR